MVQQRSKQEESLADEKQRKANEAKEKVKKSTIDKLKKYLEEKGMEIPQMEPYSPPSWFKRIDPKTLPDNLEKRYKELERKFKKRAISDEDMKNPRYANAKGGTIKVYAKGGGVRKPSY